MVHYTHMDLNIPGLDIQRDVSLAPYTTYQIGGPADYFVEVHSQDQLVTAITQARQQSIPYFLLGTGANILIGDKGFRGLVIYNQADNVEINPLSRLSGAGGDRISQDGHDVQDRSYRADALLDDSESTSDMRSPTCLLTAESGATIADLIKYTAERQLSGLEHFAGIPSSVGGALWQNLHFLSPDRSRTVFIEEVLDSAKVLMPDNSTRVVGTDFFQFGYDDSILHHQEVIVLEATFNLITKPKAEIVHQAQENLKWRRERQPQLEDFPSCGSVFKKIEGVGAGRLIDQVGLKGKQVGGAKISEKHANFLVNTGQATAADVMALAILAQEKVKAETGYQLEMEIGLVGEF